MTDSPDYYAVLGVHPSADHAVVHATWKALLRRYHPDANHGVDVCARAKAINEAFAVLGKAESRAAYDRARLPPPPRAAHSRRSVPSASSGRQPMRPRPSARPGGSVSQPLDATGWMTGLLLLILTAAPLGVILVLYNEETGPAYAAGRVAQHEVSGQPAGHGGAPSRTMNRAGQPVP